MTFPFHLRVNISISADPGPWQNGQLNVTEEIPLELDGFLECCKVLGQFHDLADAIKSPERVVTHITG